MFNIIKKKSYLSNKEMKIEEIHEITKLSIEEIEKLKN